LANIENIDASESVQAGFAVALVVFVGYGFFFATLADHWGENENAFFSSFYEAAKRVPCPKPSNIGGVGLLACDEHYVAKAVSVELRHCS